MSANKRLTGTAARWQVRVSPVGNWHCIQWTDPAHTTDRFLALTHTSYLCSRTPTENHWADTVTLSFPSALELEQEECVCRAFCKNNMGLGDSILWGDLEGRGASLQHPSVPEKQKAKMYFGKHLTRILCHIVTLSFSLSLYFHSLALTCSLMHAHAHRLSNLTLSLKTAIIASRLLWLGSDRVCSLGPALS